MPGAERRRDVLVAAVVALAVFLPFISLVAGRTLFFRDLSLYFFPLRRFVAEGLAAGEVRWWNPYVHEGEPLALPAVGYPLDLLHALWPDERFFSLLLALHLPLGAVGLFGLARALGTSRAAAAAGGLVYGLGGFALSTVNLYVYAQALGWAPWAVWGLVRACERRPRGWAVGALPVALCVSTTGIEIMAQALLAAPLLVSGARRRRGMLGPALLGIALAAAPMLVLGGAIAGSARARGFTTDVVLGHSVHPFTLMQVLVAGLYGDPARIAERWWGQNFFPLGFPYVLSLYLGAAAVALAAVGVARGGSRGRRLGVLAALALLVCLGRWVGWGVLVERVSLLRVLRYPTKAFFTVHLAAALLAALGLEALRAAPARGWRALAAGSGALGAVLVAAPLLRGLAPRALLRFAAGFFHPGLPWPQRLEHLGLMLSDAAAGGAMALAVAIVAGAAAARRLRPELAAAAVACVLGADLLRAGAGLNPALPPAAVQPSRETRALAEQMRAAGARVFTCDVATSPAYLSARAGRGERHLVWSQWASIDTLTPALNVPLAVPSAYSADLTMLVPEERVPGGGEGCAAIAGLVPRLRAAAVRYVLSLDALSDPRLQWAALVAPERIAPLRVYVYVLEDALPRAEVVEEGAAGAPGGSAVLARDAAGARLQVEAAGPAHLIVRDALAPGLSATVDGRAAAITPVEGRYRRVELPPGRSEVRFAYTPPRLALGAAVSGAAALVLLGLWLGPALSARRSPSAPSPAHDGT